MEGASIIFGLIFTITTVLGALVFSDGHHRDTGLWIVFVGIVCGMAGGFCWYQDRLWKKDDAAAEVSAAKEKAAGEIVQLQQQALEKIATSAKERSSRDPGLSLNLLIRIPNKDLDRRKYILELKGIGKESASIYISADNVFTFALVDESGESHPLRLGLGSGGIPIDTPFYLACEGGVGSQSTSLRILVDGKQLAVAELPFRVDFTGFNIDEGTLGSNLAGSDGGFFDIFQLVIYAATLPDSDVSRLKEFFEGRKNGGFATFSGEQSLRTSGVVKPGN
ncbi:MAG TPA: hypothetical protein VGN12_13970 [Pirellulales bacterium]|jgi:hypothetical protein